MTPVDASLVWLVLFPLIGVFVSYLFGKQSIKLAGILASAASILSFLWSVDLFFGLTDNTFYQQNLFTWFALDDLMIDFTLRFDHLTAVMALVVTGVGSLIHIYSIGYMHEDPHRPRFFSYLNLFMFSMLLLILGGNLLVLFVGWEGVGLCSYLLIGFWFKNKQFAKAGRKAFVVNRIGDAGFLLGIFLLYVNFGTLDFIELSSIAAHSSSQVVLFTFVTLALFVGATGKSAQIPLFIWLPDAMAGPTPVSALIHAATMVTAGVYMLARTHFLFSLAPFTGYIVCIVAVLTAFVAATIALLQTDIKKVLAYSTVSQLGFMFMAAGVGAYWVAIFHVVTHAFFKACLFLCAGSVIVGCHHEQDMRKMGGLAKLMPWTFATYLISTIAIAGIFPFSGYLSKHAILGALAGSENPFLKDSLSFLVFIATLTAIFTAFYMGRSVAMTFFGSYRGHGKPHESPAVMVLPLVVLAALATVAGVYLRDSLPHFLGHVLPVSIEHHSETILQAIIHSGWGIFGVVLAFVIYTRATFISAAAYKAFSPLAKFLEAKYFVDEFYNLIIIRPLKLLADILWRLVDVSIIDGAVNGVGRITLMKAEAIRVVQTGQIRHYALMMFLGAVFLLTFYIVL